eukprot:gnl/Dysnectes_brevis/5918_a8806_380.p1 GENE.gnl/Dysnectes_brevis/5918_a8806_380~~gnl/Dysnectes_brevis/5918_a8806_380.p1  ORF type:complete len:498 (+),score=96.55 gnl/Dysnectes_brevis/5918_a8806_380:135-1628(+)
MNSDDLSDLSISSISLSNAALMRQPDLDNTEVFDSPMSVNIQQNTFLLSDNGQSEDGLSPSKTPSKPSTTRSSGSIIFSLACTMSGASVLSYPYVYSQAGIVGGPLLGVLAYLLTATTASWIVKHSQQFRQMGGKFNITDYSEISQAFLGPVFGMLGRLASFLVMMGADISYYIYITDMFEDMACSWGWSAACGQSLNGARIAIAVVLFPVLMAVSSMRDISAIVALSSYGFIAFVALIVLVVVMALGSDPIDPSVCPLVKDELIKPGGILKSAGVFLLGFFCHNLLLSVLSVHAKPQKKKRDIWISFGVVMGISIIVGMAGYRAAYCQVGGVPQDFSTFIGDGLPGTLIRLLLCADLLVVFPIIILITRDSVDSLERAFNLTRRSPSFIVPIEAPFERGPSVAERLNEEKGKSLGRLVLINLIVLTIAFLFTLFYPNVATILGLVGALAGGIYIILLPSFTERVLQIRFGTWSLSKGVGVVGMNLVGAACVIAQFI